jgi:hypothetical protein
VRAAIRWSTITLLALASSATAATDEPTGPTDPVLERIAPVIPPGVEAFEHTRSARCEVDFRIARDGTPKWVNVDGCVHCYALASEAAAMQWRFEPGTKRYQTSFRFEVDVTQPEPSEQVVSQDDANDDLLVSVSIPVLDLEVDLATRIDDSVPLRSINEVDIIHREHPSFSDMDRDTVRDLQIFYGIDRVRCTALVLVDERGRVGGWHPEKCSPLFYDAVTIALKKWRWEPWLVEGEPTAFAYEQIFLFSTGAR